MLNNETVLCIMVFHTTVTVRNYSEEYIVTICNHQADSPLYVARCLIWYSDHM